MKTLPWLLGLLAQIQCKTLPWGQRKRALTLDFSLGKECGPGWAGELLAAFMASSIGGVI